MSNETVNMDTELHKEEICRGSDHFIHMVKSPEGCTLWATKDICEAFQKETDLCDDEFRSCLDNFVSLEPTEADISEEEIMVGEVHLA